MLATTFDSTGTTGRQAVNDTTRRHDARLLKSSLSPGQRLQVASQPGKFLVVFPLDGGKIMDAWYDRRPAVVAASPGELHVFDLRYAWSLMTSSSFEALAVEVPCATLSSSEVSRSSILSTGVAGIHRDEAAAIVGNLCSAAADLIRLDGACHDAIVQRLVQAMVSNIQFGLCPYRMYPHPCKDRLAAWQEQRIRSYVAANLTDKIRVSDVSRSCGISCSHFSRLFKNTVGISLHQWVVEQRINEAKRLLVETSAAISEIASVTGFADQAHFSRVFSRTTQATPMAWRRVRKA